MPRQQSLYDSIAQGLGDAITDIRQKVVEEPYFGREVTSGREADGPMWPEAREQEPTQDLEQEQDLEMDIDD